MKHVTVDTVTETMVKSRLVAGSRSAFVEGEMDVLSVAWFLGGCQGRVE